jgi:FlaA1/EpsC-like NDP-sugar epimerase/lipopolysaccharide/colanic/teichoic acid biosynthesis glycosyltransferase
MSAMRGSVGMGGAATGRATALLPGAGAWPSRATLEAGVRRLIDIGVAVAGLAVLAPLLGACALAVKLDSSGPVFYRGSRAGRDGRRFGLWKLRTMVVGADRGSVLTGGADPRVTRVGRFLRQWKLDEIPQLLNVLAGDMTLVGPRPEAPEIVARYTAEQRRVLRVRPGITGPSQIRFRHEETLYPSGADTEAFYLREILPAKVQSDLQYLATRTLLTDLACLWQTALAVANLSRYTVGPMAAMSVLRQGQRRLLLLLDAVLAGASYALANLLRFEGELPPGGLSDVLATVPTLLLLRVACFIAFGVYRGVWAYAGVSDLLGVVKAVSAGSGLLAVLVASGALRVPSRAAVVLDWLILVVLLGASRLSWRLLRAAAAGRRRHLRPALIIGAGQAGEAAARELQRNPRLRYRPVAFLDDDPAKRGARIHGVPVLGGIDDAALVARARDAEDAIIAIPSADRRAMRRIFERCRAAGLCMKVVPSVASLLEHASPTLGLREVHVEDLLRRAPVRLDRELIRRFLRGRRVLVTGAGGSIGSEICRQVAACEPAALVLVDRVESVLFEIDGELAASHPALDRSAVLADIKHSRKMREVFARHRPEVVFDAAAFKHVPMMEKHPEEAALNNVVGTRRLVEVAVAYGTRTFVLISSDKAVNPTNVMGATKRAAERYLQAATAGPAHGRTALCAVRFGNVLDSSGSVIPTFRKQIERGGPVTLTHPDVTRYFMTIPEAVQLVLRAAGMAQGGETFVLDMGEPVRIHDMACDMIRLSGLEPGKDVEIVVTGLRPGEKLYEELWYADEEVTSTEQDKLLVARGAPDARLSRMLARLTELERAAIAGDRPRLLRALCEIVPEYRPNGADLAAPRDVPASEDDLGLRAALEGIVATESGAAEDRPGGFGALVPALAGSAIPPDPEPSSLIPPAGRGGRARLAGWPSVASASRE